MDKINGNRYERSRPGELIHIDVKKLGRLAVAGKRMVGKRHTSGSTERNRPIAGA